MKSILPDKKKLLNKMPHIGYNDEVTGFNQAIFECEAALKQAVDEVGDEDELTIVMWEVIKESSIAKELNGRVDLYPLAKALSQHIRGCFYKEVDTK